MGDPTMFDIHRLLSSVSALFGAWVALSAASLGMTGGQFWNAVVVGAAIFLLAGYSAGKAGRDGAEAEAVWVSGLAALLGLWVVASPFVFGAGSAVMWSSIVSGVVVAVLSGYRAYAVSESAAGAAGEEAGA